MGVKSHWEQIFSKKTSQQLSWYQVHLQLSLEMLRQSGIGRTASIIDVGAGDSSFVDDMLDLGIRDITLLDVSPAALQTVRERLRERSKHIDFVASDLFSADLPANRYDLWHDRALFHFLMEKADRLRYTGTVRRVLKPGGHLVVATFAADGPESCSGLPTRRYSPEGLLEEFGADFELLDSRRESHRTPASVEQRFIYCLLRYAK